MADTRPTTTRRRAPESNRHLIGHRIRTARELRGWEPEELAHRSGLTRRRIERYEATGDLTCDELEKVATALRLPIEHFLGPCILCGADVLTAP